MNGCKGYYLLSQIRGNLPVADMQSAARSAGTLVDSGPRFRAPLLCHTIGKVDRGEGGLPFPIRQPSDRLPHSKNFRQWAKTAWSGSFLGSKGQPLTPPCGGGLVGDDLPG